MIDLFGEIIKVDGVKLVETEHLVLLTAETVRYLIALHALRLYHIVEHVIHCVVWSACIRLIFKLKTLYISVVWNALLLDDVHLESVQGKDENNEKDE